MEVIPLQGVIVRSALFRNIHDVYVFICYTVLGKIMALMLFKLLKVIVFLMHKRTLFKKKVLKQILKYIHTWYFSVFRNGHRNHHTVLKKKIRIIFLP